MKRHFALRASLTLLGTGIATAPLGGVAIHAWAGSRAALSAALGACLATLMALLTMWLWIWAVDKPQKIFLTALAGGFLGRMTIFGAAIILLAVKTELPPAAFVGGLFAYYVIYQVLEIRAVQRLGGAIQRQSLAR
jgi:hypothetical protein